jgi:hypothetical protein
MRLSIDMLGVGAVVYVAEGTGVTKATVRSGEQGLLLHAEGSPFNLLAHDSVAMFETEAEAWDCLIATLQEDRKTVDAMLRSALEQRYGGVDPQAHRIPWFTVSFDAKVQVVVQCADARSAEIWAQGIKIAEGSYTSEGVCTVFGDIERTTKLQIRKYSNGDEKPV